MGVIKKSILKKQYHEIFNFLSQPSFISSKQIVSAIPNKVNTVLYLRGKQISKMFINQQISEIYISKWFTDQPISVILVDAEKQRFRKRDGGMLVTLSNVTLIACYCKQ